MTKHDSPWATRRDVLDSRRYMIKYLDPVRRRIDWHLDASHLSNFFRGDSGYWQVGPGRGRQSR